MKNDRDNNQDENKNTYWKDLKEATQTTVKGLELTWEHFQKSIRSLAQSDTKNAISAKNQSFDINDNSNLGIVTNLYPHETMPIPDNGRYKLHNEIDDCIVCNKCVEVCPVNCIEIDAIRGTEQVGTASDGSPIRFYAAKFDIDMAKCCFCGLCTVVCPTECLTMTKEFDFSETDVSKMNYKFGNLNDNEVIEKQKEWNDFQANKEAEKEAKKIKPILKVKPILNQENNKEENPKKPIIKIKPILSKNKIENENTEKPQIKSQAKPTIKLKIKSVTEPNSQIKSIKIKLPTSKTTTTENKNLDPKLETEAQKEEPKKTQKKIIKIKFPKSDTPTQE